MKLLLAMALWCWAAGLGLAVTTLEQSYKCPIDGESWTQRIETSTRPTGLRLDLKKLGDVVEPPTLPQCPKCGLVLFKERMPEPLLKKVKAFVLSGDYQMIAAKSPSWACMAQLQEFLEAPPIHVAFSYLRASWQVEAKPALCERYLSRAYDRFSKVAERMTAGDKDRLNVLLLCGELERRLGMFDAAEARFRALLDSEEFKNEPRREPIVALQLKLIAGRDSSPQALGGKDKPAASIPLGIAPAAPALEEDSPVAPSTSERLMNLDEPFTLQAPQQPNLAPAR